MKQARTRRTLLILLTCALLLCGCAAGGGTLPATDGNAVATGGDAVATAGNAVEILSVPESQSGGLHVAPTDIVYPVNEPTGAEDQVVVSTVDELLAAIAPNRSIYLQPGVYTLTEAKDYGQTTSSPYYEWTEVYDGYSLLIHDVQRLSIVGRSASDVEINTVPRYANVLGFAQCSGVTVNSVTAGHAEGAGSCAGAVLHFADTDSVSVGYCDLYGCGTLGVEAERCAELMVENCVLRECSLGAVWLLNCRYARFQGCVMTGCGDFANPAFAMVSLSQSREVAILDCTVENNVCMRIFESTFSKDVSLLGSVIRGNAVTEAAVAATQYSPVIAGCAFTDNSVANWYAPYTESGEEAARAVSQSGAPLTADELANMRLEEIAYEAPEPTPPPAPETTVKDGVREVRATNVDEFLAAIASDTTVTLADGVYDFSKASDYGVTGMGAYEWYDKFDGPGLVIKGVTNFHIVGGGADKVTINATPRYADVLAFTDCENVSVSGATLGHTEAKGECTGGVLRFERTNTVKVQSCALFGCGILGIEAWESGSFIVDDTEIYDCSYGAVSLHQCSDVALTNCNIHDCGAPTFSVNGCTNVTNDGKALEQTND